MAASTLAKLAALELAIFISDVSGSGTPSLDLPLLERPIRVVDELLVNPSNGERFVALVRGESEGTARIRELMRRSAVEALRVFLAESGGEDAGLWVEIGGEIRSESELSSVGVDWDYLSKLIERFSDINVYHFHPLSYFEGCGSALSCNGFGVPTSVKDPSATGLINNLKYAMPSPGDIHFMMETSWSLERAHPRSASMRHRLAPPMAWWVTA